ncbi:IclR family transcriptional regulator [Antricoccus suffuscus]|uniref:IclR family transcriptional regulator n=1 Tax=Antricoccus suffuscus TaxID=1629062 RepID=A0A2T0ZTZ1_9ACTN|nr:IclR family transcriptional regulator [Antricoccus suffuscus]
MPTAYRLLATMTRHGYISRREDGKFVPGPAIYRLAFEVDSRTLLRDTIAQQVRDLRDETGESVGFFVQHGFERYCVETAKSYHDLCRSFPLYARRSVQVGASGKVFMAFSNTEELLHGFQAADVAMTKGTLKALRDDIVLTRKNGYAFSDVLPETWGIATPVYVDGALIGSLALTAPAERGGKKAIERIAGICVEQTKSVSTRLTRAINGHSSARDIQAVVKDAFVPLEGPGVANADNRNAAIFSTGK